MSYNNNFSYFNAPATNNDWWGSKDAKKPATFDESRVVKIDYNNQPYAQNYMQNYTQNMILPSESRAVEPVHPRHEVLQGTVTQLFASFGYINDNIIFSKTDVSGPMVKVGDRVAVDATYQPNNPTKYKGERVCKIDDSRFSSTTSSLSKMKPLSRDISSRIDIPLTYQNEQRKSDKKSDSKSDKKYEKNESPKRSSAPKETKKSESKKFGKINTRAISPIDLTKSDSHRTSSVKASPKSSLKRKTRSTSKNQKSSAKTSGESDKGLMKINVEKLPKLMECFSLRELDCASLKFRCKNLQPPNQFFHVSLKYQQTFPLNHPMKLGNSCHFKVFDKKVKCIDNFINEQLNRDIDPEDADTTFSAKVMLLSTDDLAEFYKQTLTLAEEFDSSNKLPITKAIKFLVGNLGPNKEFAFGGAWSPSLDGADPDSNPRVLINTAIRTCKNLTGIDLSGCSSWPKFLEIHYYRPLQKLQKKSTGHDNRSDKTDMESEERFEYIEPRMETVVYYVPDIWNCVPSQDSWNDINRMYQEQLTSLMCPPPSIPVPPKQISSTNTVVNQDEAATTDKPAGDVVVQEEEDYNFNENEEIEEKTKESEPAELTDEKPTHYANLNVDGMKIVEIKKELELRKLSSKGVMDQLKARLKSALEKEEMEDKPKGDSTSTVRPIAELKSTSDNILSEAEKNELKHLYSLPDSPHVIAHHNLRFQDSKMRIKTMSLHSLLSYYDMKLEESTFEVALFAKQFLEMLRRDAVFNLYKSLVTTPEADLVSKEENSAKKPKLMVTISKRTINRPLLFSCSLLDKEKTNKIVLDDLKNMIEGLGICLSSDQLSALLNKVKDSSKGLQYRLLTDKEIDDNDMLKIDQTDDLDYIRELAMGNKALFDEGIPMDTSVDFEEVDRLKNELDKSERCRQTLELRFAEIKDDSEKNKQLIQTQIKEIQSLKDQISEYRTKYHREQDRGDYYKKDFDKIYRDLKEIDKLSAGLGKYISESVERFKKTDKVDKPSVKPAETKSKPENKTKPKDEKPKTGNSKPVTDQIPDKSEKASEDSVISPDPITKTNDELLSTDVDADVDGDVDADVDVEMSEMETSEIDKEKETGLEEEEEEEEDDDKSADENTGDQKTINEIITQGQEDFELSKPSDYEIIILDETE